jgi:Peptidase family M1 domain
LRSGFLFVVCDCSPQLPTVCHCHLQPTTRIIMKKYLILLIAYCLSTPKQSYAQSTQRWQQQVNYTIDVRLNDTAHTLDGFAKIDYVNNSPDTIRHIWFHLWPNAFKNDKTAFSDQVLENGSKSFYFSDKEQRGYINRLDFRVDGAAINTEDHPQHIDIIKLLLLKPLYPGNSIQITTPFHVKLPHTFSRGGHIGHSYQITQWYPKPAVYDHKGWHPMPYLDQGEFYNEFGDFDVRITVPEKYVVAATGELKQEERLAPNTKTLRYAQSKVHDFAWFADKNFTVKEDTVQLPSGRVIKAFSYYVPKANSVWDSSMQYIKDAIRFRSRMLGEYPYNVVSVVQGPEGHAGGMEYPTITLIRGISRAKELDFIIEHEIGHNWFCEIIASNERRHPWMDEGMNSFYGERYMLEKYGTPGAGVLESMSGGTKGIARKLPQDEFQFALDLVLAVKRDQPINTPADQFSYYNYNIIAYLKTAQWLKEVEAYVGKEQFDAAMKAYYEKWKFGHPYPEDFRAVMESVTGKDLSAFFASLDTQEAKPVFEKNRKVKLTAFFNMRDYQKYHYISVLPAYGANKYDKFMIGLGIHNHTLPLNKFRFALFPLYATKSKQLNGIGKISYTWLPDKKVYSVQAGISGGRFSSLAGLDSSGNKVFGGFYKAVPFVQLTFNRPSRNLTTWWLDLRSYQIGEKGFTYQLDKTDSNYYPFENKYEHRYLNQLTVGVDNYRILYPYDAQLQLQQAKNFYRLNFTGNYFFNYAKGGGMNVRLFAAKFGYIGSLSAGEELDTYQYQPKLTAVRGSEDYTYSNYFIGRNEIEGAASQQIMMRDGGLKLRTDLFQDLQGRSDNWIASLNFNTTLPDKLFPVKLPVKLFLDVGTYAEAWKKDAATSRFLYVGGIQLSLFGELVNIYAPLVFSSEFRNNLKTVPDQYKFLNRISFSIDVHMLSIRKVFTDIPVF